jgi:TetR/AcrR family fatty acid metabolism transcriptional regulator
MAPIVIDKEAKRKQILKAAQTVFARNGYHKATIAQIAAEAEIGKGTVYEYFPDKRELFRGCIKLFMSEIEFELERELASITDPSARIRTFITSLFKEYIKQSDRMELMLIFWAEAVQSQEIAWRDITIEAYNSLGAWMDATIQQGIAAGLFRRIDTKSFSSIILGAMDGLMFQWIMYRGKMDLEGMSEKLADMAVYLLQENNKRVLFPFIW